MKVPAAKILFLAACLAAMVFAAFLAYQHVQRGAPVYFFAYGAALDQATMKARAGGFENATAASVPGYRLAFQTNRKTEFGVANLVEERGSRAYGALYALTQEQFASLEKSSGSPGFYRRIQVRAELQDGGGRDAVAFVLAGEAFPAQPSRPYLAATAGGMKQFGYGNDAVESLTAAAQAS